MKPAAFEYHIPETVDAAIGLLTSLEEAKPIAGGQSLIPMLNMRLAQPQALVDLGGIRDLHYIRPEDDCLVVGAMTTQRELASDPTVRRAYPVITEVVGHIGHPTIRNRGTVGGSLSHADPAAELPLLAIALDAEMVVQGPRGRRELPASEFFVQYLTTALAADELLVEVRFKALPDGSRFGFEELTRRHGDFAIVSALALVRTADGLVDWARLVVGGANPVPLSIMEAEAILIGSEPSEDAIREAARSVPAAVEPLWDVHATAEYRRQVAEVIARRALIRAVKSGDES